MRRRIDRTGQKHCGRCKRWLSLSEFKDKPNNKDGKSSICSMCYEGKNKVLFGVEPEYTDKSKTRAYESQKKVNSDAVSAFKSGLSYGQWMGLRMLEKNKNVKV